MKWKLFWMLILGSFSWLVAYSITFWTQLIKPEPDPVYTIDPVPAKPIRPVKPVKPVECPMVYNPVCWVDWKNYSNKCVALYQHHVQIAYKGKCKVNTIKKKKYLNSKNIKVINKMLENKLFKKIENKPIQYQVKRLTTINKKIDILLNKLKEKHWKKIDLVKENLEYIKERITEKLPKIDK